MTTESAVDLVLPPAPKVAKELVKSTGFLLGRTGMGFKLKAMAAFEAAGFEAHDYGLLAILAEGVPVSQAALADALTVDPSRVVALLDSLEERGLVERRRDPEDRRRHVVTITADGTRELGKLRETIKRLEDDYLAALDPESRRALHELLLQIACDNDPRCANAAGPG